MNQKEFIKEEKDCADLVGMSLNEYQKSLEKVVPPKFEKETKEHKEKSKNILKSLGVSESLLKKRVV